MAALALGAFTLFTSGPASAYSGSCVAQVSNQHPHSGETITVTGTATPPADQPNAVNDWTLSFNGSVQHISGNTLNTTLTVPTVSQPQAFTLTIGCSFSPGSLSSFVIQVDTAANGQGPGGSGLPNTHGPGGSGLPNTGGPSIWWLLMALLALASGTVLVTRRRQPAAHHVSGHRR